MTRDEILALSDDALLRLCRMDTFRSTGPGGQHRNTTDSAVRLTLEPRPEISVSVCESRSQLDNRRKALRRLRLHIALLWRADTPVPGGLPETAPGRKSDAYAPYLAILLDALHQHGGSVADAARALGLSTGRYVRILGQDDAVWSAVQTQRQQAGQKPLRHG